MAQESEAVPATLLVGFLGSGKTTLVNRLLAEPDGSRIAVIVNEFGDVGIDGDLVISSNEEVIELTNGCICCTVRDDLARGVDRLLRRRTRRWFGRLTFDRLLIEASGMATPGPAVQTLLVDPRLIGRVALDGIVAMANAAEIERQLESQPEVAEQIAYADKLLLNHADRVDEATLEAATASLRTLHPELDIQRTVRAEVRPEEVFGQGTRHPTRESPPQDSAHAHSHGIGAVVLSTRAPLDLHELKIWLQFIAKFKDHEVMRIKGIVRTVQIAAGVVVHGVYQYLEIGPDERPAPEESRLVLIGRNLESGFIKGGWDHCQRNTEGTRDSQDCSP